MRVTICGASESSTLQNTLKTVVDCVDSVAHINSVDRADAELVITVGEEPLRDCAVRGEPRPILPVGLNIELSPSHEQLPVLVRQLAEYDAQQPPIVDVHPLDISVGDQQSIAVFDTTLMTSEPARISEYAVRVGGRPHAEFRADGVVVASPLGSSGYNRAAGGPQLAPKTGVAVVPIAPFATIADKWVLTPPLSVAVERDDSVSVFADTTHLTTGGAELTVDIETGEPLSLVDVPSVLDSP
jgi:NAD+ kinase